MTDAPMHITGGGGWTPGKAEKCRLLLPRILREVATALEVAPDDVWAVWEGHRPIMARAAAEPTIIDLAASTPNASPPHRTRGKPTIVFSDDMRAELRKLAGTISAEEISRRLGVGRSSLYREATTLGLSLRVVIKSQTDRFARLPELAGTMSVPALAAELGVGASTVFARARKLGISLRVRSPGAAPAPTPPSDAKVEPDEAAMIDDCRLVNRLGAWLRKDGEGFTRAVSLAWRGTRDQAAVLQRRNPEFRRLKTEVL